jgi:hypothetical protein
MSQDLLKISLESLQLQLPAISFGTLKSLYAQLYQHMRNNGKRMTQAEAVVIQRKITKIQGEMNRRKKLGSEFQMWDRKLMRDLHRG